MKSHGKWRRRLNGWGLVSTFVLILVPLAADLARAADDDDEYNFSWLDPEKKVYVLQNRKFTKADRVQITLMGGLGLSNPYRTSMSIEPRMAFWFSEQLGVEAFFSSVSNSENNTAKALSDASGTAPLPVIRSVKQQFGGLVKWAPWYSKINVFNSILYFDWYFTAGAGSMSFDLTTRSTTGGPIVTTSENKTAYYFGTGHEFHLTQHFDVRLDLTGGYYQSPVFGTRGANAWFSNYTFAAGIGWRI